MSTLQALTFKARPQPGAPSPLRDGATVTGSGRTAWVWALCAGLMIVGSGLFGCSQAPRQPAPSAGTVPPTSAPALAAIEQPQSRWVPVAWSQLPGWEQDTLSQAWPAWLRSCERPAPAWRSLCPDLRQLAQAPEHARRAWVQERLQPYRVENRDGRTEGLLTGYYEPLLAASRQPAGAFRVPLYAPPAKLTQPWFTRQEIESPGPAQTALRGLALMYLNDPVDALVLHIQGSGLLQVREPDGRVRLVRLAFAGTNGRPYKSIGRWLLDQGLIQDASWPGIKAWLARNPSRTQELLWQNPRYVFFREEALPAAGGSLAQPVLSDLPGPKGAQGVPLSAGRSIAVDPGSIPYGTPVWLSSPGPTLQTQRLVLAQDTGSAIVGAVRADYFAGAGAEAGEMAGRLKQPLQLWVLWPR